MKKEKKGVIIGITALILIVLAIPLSAEENTETKEV